MTATIDIRRAVSADFQFIVDSNVALAWETEGLELDAATVRAGVEAVLADGSLGFYVLAAVDGLPAGQLMVTFEWSDWRNGLWWWIQSVYVVPQHRRGGIYSALHRHVELLARDAAGVCGIRLYVEQENAVGQRVYQSLQMYQTRYFMYEIQF